VDKVKLSVDLHSFVAKVEQMIRNGDVELKTSNERKTYKITRVRFDKEQGIQVIVGHLYSHWFIPKNITKKYLFDEIIYHFRDLSAKLDGEKLNLDI
jgi:hypothetical protein